MIDDFFQTVLNLKNVKRQGWVDKLGLTSVESVADHTYSVSLLSMVLSDMQDYDTLKILKMSLLHDLAESITGDFTPNKISQEKKQELENKTMKQIFENIPSPLKENYLLLWNEYQQNTTKESQLLHEVDKLEMALQANYYLANGLDKEKLKPFVESAKNSIVSEDVKKILMKITTSFDDV